MYRLGHQIRHRRWPFVIGGLLLVGCAATGIVLSPRIFKQDTRLTQSPPVTRRISTEDTAKQHIVTRAFTLDLPSGWRTAAPLQVQPVPLSWSGTAHDGAGRRLDVYVDRLPAAMPANRLLPVQPAGDRINPVGTVSDNCTNFTDKATESAATGTAPAKWNGVNFICDMANYERDVVVTGSTGGVNMVTLSSKSGMRQVCLVYTDNSINPDYSVFTDIVQSFTLL